MANEVPAGEILNVLAGAFISLVETMVSVDPKTDPSGPITINGNIRDITLHPLKTDAPRSEIH